MLMRNEGNPRSVASQRIGKALTDQAIDVLTAGKVETAVRERRDPAKCKGRRNARFERPAVEWLDSPRVESNEIVRKGLALLLAVLEHVTLHGEHEGRVAAGPYLFMGHQRAPDSDGVWSYVPAAGQGSLAARLHSDVRQIERLIAILVAGRVIKAWQPPAKDEHGKPLPPHLRGETYAYQMYSIAHVPAALALTIRRFTGTAKERAALERAELAGAPAAGTAAADGVDFGCPDDLHAQALARMRAGRDPPS
jgi:hypothetical protein